jgi:hypothetical protein
MAINFCKTINTSKYDKLFVVQNMAEYDGCVNKNSLNEDAKYK